QVVTDNGKEFLGNFDKTLQEASIKHIWTYPYTPKMNATCERFNRTLREQFIEFNELLLFEDLNLFNQRMAEYLVLYNSKRPHKSLELMTPVDYILRESKNCNMWWTHTSRSVTFGAKQRCHALVQRMRLTASLYTSERSLFPTEITKTTTFSSITWYTRR
ncbi:TPA: transposase, partial [Klebsiella pneumoniae]|nr:transposase [Klebsiella pneumoniae]